MRHPFAGQVRNTLIRSARPWHGGCFGHGRRTGFSDDLMTHRGIAMAADIEQHIQGRRQRRRAIFDLVCGPRAARGWTLAGKEGPKEECLAYIEEVWTDMRPKSLQEADG